MVSFKKSVAMALALISLSTPLKSNAQHEGQILGSFLGAAVGGIAGHQFGKGDGKTAATLAGVGLGAIVGNLIGRAIDRRDVSDIPDVDYARLKTENYRHRAGDVYIHVYYNREMFPRSPEFKECMEYDLYAKVDGYRGRTQTRYACFDGDGWTEVERKDVTDINPRSTVSAPSPFPPQAPQSPVITYFSHQDMLTVANAVRATQIESERIALLDQYMRSYAAHGRVLSPDQANYFLGYFLDQRTHAQAIMAPMIR